MTVNSSSDRVPARPLLRASNQRLVAGFGLTLLCASGSLAQVTAPAVPQKETVVDGYTIHQSIDLGGRIAGYSGSGAMYDTLVNLQSGPRIFNNSLDMRAIGKTRYPFFDNLTINSSGYGGDPLNVTTLRMSKGKLYDFQGLFRRDRQYFDYNLLDNPLVPTGVVSNGYTFPQVKDSPHLFNTVRRMTDVSLTLLPLSRLKFRAGYSQNINQGPSYSSLHNGDEALFLQNWRNSTDTWLGAVDWKVFSRTVLSFQEHVTHYKGDTNWQLTGLNMQLSNGTPVTLGFDNVALPKCGDKLPPIVTSTTSPPTANATCPGYTQYSRYEPMRTLFPTEEFLFQSSNIRNILMNGRVRYTGAKMNIPHQSEHFFGLDNQGLVGIDTTGYGSAKRINVSADYGTVWQVSKKFSLSEQFDFSNFRQPADSYLTEIDQTGTSMLIAPDPAQPPILTAPHNFLGMKTDTNTTTVGWRASSKASVSLGYRYRARTIGFVMPLATDALANGTSYILNLHENGGLLAVSLRPTSQWRVNGNIDVTYADNTYTQISPRAAQHYIFRVSYRPKNWANISGTFNDLERHNNVAFVSHQDHSRSLTLGVAMTPNQHYGLDLNYGYMDIFTRTGLCYAATPAPVGALASPADCGTNLYLGDGFYDAPSQYGSIGITFTPVKQFRLAVGYTMSAVNGATEIFNPRQAPGSLQSQYQTPYVKLAWSIYPGWVVKGDWNYYGYGENTPVGPTSPRSFHGNVYTIGAHHEF